MVSRPVEVWVTGMAWSTALGDDLEVVWQSLLAGRSGIRSVDFPVALRSPLASPLPDLDPALPLPERQHRLTVTTIRRALQDAGLAKATEEVVPVLATSYGHHLDEPETESLSRWAVEAAREAGCQHAPITVSTACSAGADALLLGLSLIRRGFTDICLCGGADILTPAKRLGHSQLGTLSADGLRAFDRARSGTVLGEGAGFLVLETRAAALARGARPYGILAGAGSANDAVSAVAPDLSGDCLALAVRRALCDAGLTAHEVGCISTHGTGTRLNDEVETKTYSDLFASSPRLPLLFGTKGAFGHTLGATGALEAISLLLALGNQQVPPIVGLENPLTGIALPLAMRTALACPAEVGISVTLGFGGFDTCLVFQRAREAMR
ncbi:Coronafacic acid beta-ketoacyl synthetase component [Pseudomonas savastanoi pv. glycinea]|uniref:Coronafacic acid beta-ketoacyl synthetase component n=3 Tax=Pseudomonas syringae group TaxID=136849 RepID=A0A0P9LNK5_PSECA|nr:MULTISPECIES: beta-ketoacyl-[acyl-carrier-protein] synthase family protein [Pseudomonas syringae group]KAA8706486.1 beta-ketoacyl-[acyl-carrier-protein] synthase family protein [Pseudomonas cannabina]KPW79756.1 Coronafacic acid beta-ketoacyl synthetase component [Pseudomonas cannabina]KPX47041.1 Coronafacic acid beta-ketoacyl synthetase component [Pseudomonas savastanoi pv. glycinea]KWT05177.1 beta-ketoacyl synthase [Pseudomonas amygdali pv. aesculi]KWT21290.1 beta-ketoacyl synthase [Pseudo